MPKTDSRKGAAYGSVLRPAKESRKDYNAVLAVWDQLRRMRCIDRC